jgi:hypothetical protein
MQQPEVTPAFCCHVLLWRMVTHLRDAGTLAGYILPLVIPKAHIL